MPRSRPSDRARTRAALGQRDFCLPSDSGRATSTPASKRLAQRHDPLRPGVASPAQFRSARPACVSLQSSRGVPSVTAIRSRARAKDFAYFRSPPSAAEIGPSVAALPRARSRKTPSSGSQRPRRSGATASLFSPQQHSSFRRARPGSPRTSSRFAARAIFVRGFAARAGCADHGQKIRLRSPVGRRLHAPRLGKCLGVTHPAPGEEGELPLVAIRVVQRLRKHMTPPELFAALRDHEFARRRIDRGSLERVQHPRPRVGAAARNSSVITKSPGPRKARRDGTNQRRPNARRPSPRRRLVGRVEERVIAPLPSM